jgi:uncharacterized protein (DUF983 family)
MLKEISYSVLWNKCPKCHEGNVFVSNNPYKLTQLSTMHQNCACCNEKYEKEPGYFFGAMYVSYALMVGWFVITWAIDSFWINSIGANYVIFVVATMLLFMPITFRVSRLIWMNFFTHFDTECNCKNELKPIL